MSMQSILCPVPARQISMDATSEHPQRPIRVIFADDSYLMREALARVFDRLPGVEAVAGCDDGDALLAAVAEHRPDVVVTDVRMPPSGDDEGIRVASHLRRSEPGIGVVVLSQYADPRYARQLVEGGAHGRGYLLKDRVNDPSELRAAIEAVALGGSVFDPAIVRLLVTGAPPSGTPLAGLTPRERQVLSAMAQGKSNAAIADSLFLTKKAIERHVGSIFLKLELPEEHVVSRRVAAVLLYLSAEGG
jgi:DNA-binding NarL/FixJ family response regulator